MTRKLLILGAGQLGYMVQEIAKEMNCFEQIHFLDDANPAAIAPLSMYEHFVSSYSDAIVAIGNSEYQLAWIEKLTSAGFRIPEIISPYAYVSPSAKLLEGVIVEANATVQTEATISSGCIISSGAVVRHNVFLPEGCHVDCNAVVYTGSVVPPNFKIPACTVYTACPN